jgi:hypothetical protein
MNTNKGNCKGYPFNFQPEYNTAQPQNITPWTALLTGILDQFEIGHFTPCTSLSGSGSFTIEGFTDTFATTCSGPYESTASPDSGNPEGSDAPCYPRGDTHGGVAPPNEVTGCPGIVGPFSGSSDVDYDGTSYSPANIERKPVLTGPVRDGRPRHRVHVQCDDALRVRRATTWCAWELLPLLDAGVGQR